MDKREAWSAWRRAKEHLEFDDDNAAYEEILPVAKEIAGDRQITGWGGKTLHNMDD